MAGLLGGIFVGGRGSRMGGVAKGLLLAPDGAPIVVRTAALLERVGVDRVLVGAHPAYTALGLDIVADVPDVEGPLAGLLGLFAVAGERDVIAIACDMPFLGLELLRRLVDAPPAPIVAPRHRDPARDRDVWEPLCARYAASVFPVARAFAAAGERKLQRLLDTAGAESLTLSANEEAMLVDWDVLPVDPGRGSRET